MGKARPAHRKACSRCRKRKTKCDNKLPSCSSCERAGVSCMAYDNVQKEVPRSIVSHFEDAIANLETEIAAAKSRHPQSSPPIEVKEQLLKERMKTAMIEPLQVGSMQKSMVKNLAGLRLAFQIRSSSLPRPFSARDALAYGPDRVAKPISFDAIPRVAADLLLKNYIEIHVPQYPAVYEPDLIQRYQTCFDDYGNASPLDVFITCMVLAISANTLIWRHEENALSASASLWARAQEQLACTELYESSIMQVQIALLLAHYGFTRPSAVDVWFCVGEAMRLCVHLGFHVELSQGTEPNAIKVDERRRLFWTAYGMERALCSYMRQQPVLKENDITCQLPSTIADHCITTNGISSGPSKKASAWHMLQFRQLEMEVYEYLYTDDSPDISAGFEEWASGITTRLESWYARAEEFGRENKLEFRNIQLHFLRSRLHRPAPRRPRPTRESRLILIDSITRLAEDYSKQRSNGRLFYPWHAGHILFEAAVVLLDTCWSIGNLNLETKDFRRLSGVMNNFPDVLRQVSAFWPALRLCAEKVEELTVPALAYLRDLADGRGSLTTSTEENTTAILQNYLFPAVELNSELKNGPAITGGLADEQTNDSTLQTFDLDAAAWENMEVDMQDLFALLSNQFWIDTDSSLTTKLRWNS